MPVPLTPAQELAALRVKYPTGLLCTSPEPCEHRVLATTPAGYSESNLTEADRLSFICASCRGGGRPAVDVAAKLTHARELAQARRLRPPLQVLGAANREGRDPASLRFLELAAAVELDLPGASSLEALEAARGDVPGADRGRHPTRPGSSRHTRAARSGLRGRRLSTRQVRPTERQLAALARVNDARRAVRS